MATLRAWSFISLKYLGHRQPRACHVTDEMPAPSAPWKYLSAIYCDNTTSNLSVSSLGGSSHELLTFASLIAEPLN